MITVHKCKMLRLIDGDTFLIQGDISPIVPYAKIWEPRVRLAHVDAPEKREAGYQEAIDLAADWFRGSGPFDLRIQGLDNFGRIVSECIGQNSSLSDYLLAKGVPKYTIVLHSFS